MKVMKWFWIVWVRCLLFVCLGVIWWFVLWFCFFLGYCVVCIVVRVEM